MKLAQSTPLDKTESLNPTQQLVQVVGPSIAVANNLSLEDLAQGKRALEAMMHGVEVVDVKSQPVSFE